jgi:MraZ protein
MIIGQQDAKVDSKYRCALPKKFREALGHHIVITQGFEECLVVVSEENFASIVAETASLPFTMQAARHTNRYLLGNADRLELDAQGRFIVPEYLRSFAKIKEEVVFIGVGTFIEMWDKPKWLEYQRYLAQEGSSIAEKLRETPRS